MALTLVKIGLCYLVIFKRCLTRGAAAVVSRDAVILSDQCLLYFKSSPRAHWKENTSWQQRAKPPAPFGATRSGPPPKKALVGMGAAAEARQVLTYLISTQQADGHCLQNQWLGGKPFWQGVQRDEPGFPVLLAAALQAERTLEGIAVADMLRRALH